MQRDTGWYKSSRSTAANNSCVEVRITDNTVAVRDSKNRSGATLNFSHHAWSSFLQRFKEK
ncbi:DUF397 domain-containing protein [Streptoalloteichus hindustanus]|uniref:DUF397 domain-containing protein n=1 Tax=Streptoalloteichus hindustanus TaxID=2017 RepID=A0A1M5PH02_STRHI|nr:DUF397 domain-containing protein [Streptoalloteichus hindustanus]SHH01062.1 protein of unknown function [Streptoalloteichus hindustanus]